MKRLADAWSRFWFAYTDGLPLGVVRIGVALAGLYLWLGTVRWLPRFYADSGEFPIAAARQWSVEYVARYLMPDLLGSLPAVYALAALQLVFLVALLVGYRTRSAAVGVSLMALWFFFRNPTFVNGGDEVNRLVTYYLALGYLFIPVEGRSLSLDRRLAVRAGRVPADAPARVPAWPLRLIQVQICVVYLVAGFWKTLGPAWSDGSALALALGNSTFSRFGFPQWAWLRWIDVPLVWLVAWWEFLFPVLVWMKRFRRPVLAFGVMLHVGILVLMNIGIFPVIMLACYPAFMRAGELEALGRRLPRWTRLRPPVDAEAAAAA